MDIALQELVDHARIGWMDLVSLLPDEIWTVFTHAGFSLHQHNTLKDFQFGHFQRDVGRRDKRGIE